MLTVLFFIVFPGVPLLFMARWFMADRRYRGHMSSSGIDLNVLPAASFRTVLHWTTQAMSERSEADRRVRAGEFGSEAVGLLAASSSAFKNYATSLVVSGLMAFLMTGFTK